MKYLVKDTPIRKNGKTYGVGKEFPYSDKDSKLLWNLTEVKEISKGNSTENKVESKKPATKHSPSIDGKKTTKKGQSK